ncbi:MAG: LssY C-terminal domain-containing protein [bacterium]|nr:LssY C-terminal domain-containing protein [bacterium]
MSFSFNSSAQSIDDEQNTDELPGFFARFFYVVRSRFSLHEKYGLPLTIGIALTLFFVFVFLGILQDYIGHDPLVQADIRVVKVVELFRSHTLNNVMLFMSNLGKWQIVFSGMIVIGFILFSLNLLPYLFMLVVSASGGELIVSLIKNMVARPRPPIISSLLLENGFSFPSGHGFIAFSFYGFLAYIIYRTSRKKIWKAMAIVGGAGVIGFIAFSRVYLGAHWPSDVLASLALGAAWLCVLITILEIRRTVPAKSDEKALIGKRFILIPSLVLFLLWIFYMSYFFSNIAFSSPGTLIENAIYIEEKDIPAALFSQLPLSSETITGLPMEPINIIVVGSYENLVAAFESVGWVQPDPITLKTGWRHTVASIFDKPYPKALETPSFWNSQTNDFAFQLPTKTIRQRYHVHFWTTPLLTDQHRRIWFATSHFDQAINFKTIWPTHKINPDVDNTRNKIKDDISKTGMLEKAEELQIVQARQGKNQAGDAFSTDGKAFVLFLKDKGGR